MQDDDSSQQIQSLYSVGEVAAELGVSPRTVQYLMADHKLEYLKIRGRTLIERAEVKRYVREQRGAAKLKSKVSPGWKAAVNERLGVK